MTEPQRCVEHRRLHATDGSVAAWRRWGPYVSDRQWGTVREDYSDTGDAWSYFTHDQARSRAYRWGEDGIAGFSDDRQLLCLSIALWNGNDPILKERLFGLTNAEGNHGEDVKEYYFHLDATPTHSYQRLLYKYPHAAYPYEDLVATNRERRRDEPEYELLDTGVFDEDRYFDVTIEYAKGSPDDVLLKVTAVNRGPDAATLHLLPTTWFRNTWSTLEGPRPELRLAGAGLVEVEHPELGHWTLSCDEDAELLFCDNETNEARFRPGSDTPPYPKDAINDRVVAGNQGAVNPAGRGTKCAAWREVTVAGGGEIVARLRLRRRTEGAETGLGEDFDGVFDARRAEADEFYGTIMPSSLTDDHRLVLRQALAGVLWTKQYYEFDVDQWLKDHDGHPLRAPKRLGVRNANWFHMRNGDVISMPDKWEYPWFAAWDLAFHTIAIEMVDPQFAKDQINLMLSEPYLHPSGQMPAYEWNFGDVNPPVHAWATLFAYVSAAEEGGADVDFLRSAFKKLLLNFSWWVNRKDREGRNLFEGGFLGLDNIGVFDRSSPLPTGGHLEQADGTAWMALYSQNMLELALELAVNDETYEDLALRFVQHFFWIASAMDPVGDADSELWDEEDGFYYDVLWLPDGTAQRLKVRSMVGLLPLCAVTVVSAETLERFPQISSRVASYLERNRDLLVNIADPTLPGVNGRRLLSVLNETKLRRVLARMLDEERFFSPHGVRSLSRSHLDDPFVFDVHGDRHEVKYLPAESDSGLFGGNSNWRGPIWFPTNLLLIRALLQYYLYYGDDFRIECPTGSGVQMTLFEVARELSMRLCGIFLRDEDGRRPVYGDIEKFQSDPHWRDLVLFHEYFHGDTGAGLGASHQTGWTAGVARLLQMFGAVSPEDLLQGGTRPMARPWHQDG